MCMYHNQKKCRNCVLNGDCLLDDSDVEDCDGGDENNEDDDDDAIVYLNP